MITLQGSACGARTIDVAGFGPRAFAMGWMRFGVPALTTSEGTGATAFEDVMPKWLPQEDDVIRELWLSVDARTMMLQLPGRDRIAIGCRARRLGFQKGGGQKDWNVAFDFWVNKDAQNGCWEWLGSLNEGYGLVSFPKSRGGKWRAHRYSWYRAHGRIPRDLHVLHKCHNKRCVNPEHLYLGTQADNQLDEVKKGRIQDVLNPASVLEIRRLAKTGLNYPQIAKEMGVPTGVVANCVRRDTWDWVEEPK